MSFTSVRFSAAHGIHFGTHTNGQTLPVVQLANGIWAQADPRFYTAPKLGASGQPYVTHTRTQQQVLASVFQQYAHLSSQSSFSAGAPAAPAQTQAAGVSSATFSASHNIHFGRLPNGQTVPTVQLQNGQWVQANPSFYSAPFRAANGQAYVRHNQTGQNVLASVFPQHANMTWQAAPAAAAPAPATQARPAPASSGQFFSQSRTGWLQVYVNKPTGQVSWKWDAAHINDANAVYAYLASKGHPVTGTPDANPMKGNYAYNMTVQQIQSLGL